MEDETTKKPARTRAPKAEAPEEQTGEETVVVSKKDLEAFLNRLEAVETENKKLVAVADKGRLYSEEERLAKQTGTPLIHTVKLTKYDNKIVVAWKLIDNESYVENGRVIERQNIELYFEDGSNSTVRLIDFYRNGDKKTKGEVVRRSRNEETGVVEFSVRLSDGKTLIIPATFVN